MAAEHVARIGARMRAAREELGLSQAAVARQLPGTVDGNQVSRWERGLHKPSDETLELIAKILGKDYSYFVAPEAPDKSVTPSPFPEPDQIARIERCVVGNSETLARLQEAVELLTLAVSEQAVVLTRIEDAGAQVLRELRRGDS